MRFAKWGNVSLNSTINTPRYLFGPVASRRYGQSLGIDLATPKTCSLNCRFCQLGPTPTTTITRSDSPPIQEVLDELRAWLASHPPVDFITASGSGEPTLHLRFGDLFQFVRNETPSRSLLLSNGSLFTLPDVRHHAARADVVKLSLHAWDQESFSQITRPHPSLVFDEILAGFLTFRTQFSGRLDLEVFIIPGLNDLPEQVMRIAAHAKRIAPDSITLNTAIRPPVENDVTACSPQHLRDLAKLFSPIAQVSGTEPTATPAPFSDDALIALVHRHPVSLTALCETYSLEKKEMLSVLEKLFYQNKIHLFDRTGIPFAGPLSLKNQHTDQSPTEEHPNR